jgi:predicted TIM-barrel fold metal-dependent hydrolase
MVLDIHTHVGPLDSAIDGVDRTPPGNIEADYELRTRIMDNNGIDEAVVIPSHVYDKRAGSDGVKQLNDRTLEIVESHDRLKGPVGIVEPSHGAAAREELHRLDDLGFLGVSFHHGYQGMSIDAQASVELYETIDTLDLTPIIHCFSPDYDFERVDRLDRIADVFDEPVVVLDALANWGQIDTVIDIGRRHDHLYFDTAMLVPLGRVTERLVDELGADRILFGSDLYTRPLLYERSTALWQLRNAEITDEQRRRILGQNAREILDV